ncbi:MAG: hypothetical protein QOE70_838 [Chthoniobacter sp.]|jgi:hypothetical protein|nr:hypothetical protein [Chthoniobacter sp.]
MAILGLVILALLCGFGFLASYELTSAAARLPWQIGYGLVATVSLVTAFRVGHRIGRKT